MMRIAGFDFPVFCAFANAFDIQLAGRCSFCSGVPRDFYRFGVCLQRPECRTAYLDEVIVVDRLEVNLWLLEQALFHQGPESI